MNSDTLNPLARTAPAIDTPGVRQPTGRANSRTHWLRTFHGPFTQELERHPGRFALGQLPARALPQTTARSICGFCSTGCSLELHLRDGHALNLTPDRDYPVNHGFACPKGWEALAPLDSPNRAAHPLLRDADGTRRRVDWPTAMAEFAARFRSIQERHGPDSLAWIGTGQITNEELAFLGALGRFGIGIRHGDGNTRQCMATAATAYKESFGFDAPPYTYADLEQSDVLVFIGANPCIAHPILWQRVLRNPRQPTLLVVDPRRTETAAAATHHLALRPRSDLVLLYGLAHLLIQTGGVDQAFVAQHTTGFEAFAEFVRAFTPDRVARDTDLSVGQILRFAEIIRHGRAVSFWWTMGVNQGHEATRTAQAIINLALLTGNIGRPGTGANSITGQCNAMGSRLFSNTTQLIGGGSFHDPNARLRVAKALGIPQETIPDQGGWAYDQIIEGLRNDRIKGLWIVATNPAHSWIARQELRELLGRLEFLVVQDMFANTETAAHAHLLLPAAGWGEKEGTFINSERRLGVVRRVRRPPGEALSDFAIFRLAATAFGCAPLFREWTSPRAAFQILKRTTRGQPCDINGIRDYDHLDSAGGIQWPFPETQPIESEEPPQQERRLFEDGHFPTADHRARFVFGPIADLPEPPDTAFPWILLTGRGTSAQWHTNTRTGESDVLRLLYPQEAYAEINPVDAERLGLTAGGRLRIHSRRGTMEARPHLTDQVAPGHVFIPMHYPDVNNLTLPVFDPHSRQPAYKHCAVRLECIP